MWKRVQSRWQIISHPVGRSFTAIATIVGVTGGVAALSPMFTSSNSAQEIIQASALGAVTIVSLLALAHRELVFAKRRRIAHTIRDQRAASELLRDVWAYINVLLQNAKAGQEITTRELSYARELLEQVLDKYATIFTLSTATRCRMTIKSIFSQDNTLYVFALARDPASANENRRDDEKRAKLLHDTLEENSDFLSLFDPEVPDEGYYFSKDVNKEPGYKSTSRSYWRTVKADPTEKHTGEDNEFRYKSVIVWPIRQDRRDSIGHTRDRCLGFLAVDSESEDAFERQWDAHLGKAFANSLYPVLDRYSELDRLAHRSSGGAASAHQAE